MERIDIMDNNEILRKALGEALTDKYSAELNSAPEVAEQPSPEFTSKMNNVIRKTDRPFFQYAKYTLIAACACLIVGAAIIVPAFHINNMLTGGNNSMEAVPGYGDSDMNMGADGTMSPSHEDGFRGDADEAPDSYPSDIPTSDSEESNKGDDPTVGTETNPSGGEASEYPITEAVKSQTLSEKMFEEGMLSVFSGFEDNTTHVEYQVADMKTVVEMIYGIFGSESVPSDTPIEDNSLSAYLKFALTNGNVVYISFTAEGYAVLEENGFQYKCDFGEKRISYYVNRIIDEQTEIGTQTDVAETPPTTDTDYDSDRPITNAVMSQTLHYNMFADGTLTVNGEYYSNIESGEYCGFDMKTIVELIYEIYATESVPTVGEEPAAWIKLGLSDGRYAGITFTTDGNAMIEDGNYIHKVFIGNERRDYYVNRLVDQAANSSQQGTTTQPIYTETLAELLDGKEIGAFTNAVITSPVSSQYPPEITDSAKLKELYKLIYTYGEELKLTYTGGDPESYYHEYVWIQTDDDGGIDIRIAYGKIIVGKYYFFYADESVINAICSYVSENVDSAYEGEMDYYIKPYEE